MTKGKLIHTIPGGRSVELAKVIIKKLLETSNLASAFSARVHAMFRHINYIGSRFRNRHLCFQGKG